MIPAEEGLPGFLYLAFGFDVYNIDLTKFESWIVLPSMRHQMYRLYVCRWCAIAENGEHISFAQEPFEPLPFIRNERVGVIVLVLNRI